LREISDGLAVAGESKTGDLVERRPREPRGRLDRAAAEQRIGHDAVGAERHGARRTAAEEALDLLEVVSQQGGVGRAPGGRLERRDDEALVVVGERQRLLLGGEDGRLVVPVDDVDALALARDVAYDLPAGTQDRVAHRLEALEERRALDDPGLAVLPDLEDGDVLFLPEADGIDLVQAVDAAPVPHEAELSALELPPGGRGPVGRDAQEGPDDARGGVDLRDQFLARPQRRHLLR